MRVAITRALGMNGVFVVRALRESGVEILATGRDDDFGFEAPPLAAALIDYVRSLQDAV